MLRKILRNIPRFSSRPVFRTKDVVIGKNVTFGKGVKFNCERVRIGDGCIFQDNITVDCTSFEIGDYGTIYTDCFFPGPGSLVIGHNFWMGKGAILDSKGGVVLKNNICLAAYSQVWSHMIFGDTMMGCQFHSEKEVKIDDDVWIGPGCLISPRHLKERSMVLMGGLLVSDTQENHVYGGVPAKDITEKTGPQFQETSLVEKKKILGEKLSEFSKSYKTGDYNEFIKIIDNHDSEIDPSKINLDITSRTYTKIGSRIEFKLMRFLLPEIKFIPKR